MEEKDEKKLIKRVTSIEDRLSLIEKRLEIDQEDIAAVSAKNTTFKEEIVTSTSRFSKKSHESSSHETKTSEIPNFTFNQIITFLGVLGIIIGVISFFFYAVANNWIGEAAQIGIGVIIGFVLFGFAYSLREDKENWSNIVLGGSYFVEYLSIGVGVNSYKVLPEMFGLFLGLIFLISSIIFSLKFSSRTIAYFSLVGGYLIPMISGMYSSDLFVMSFYTLLSLALVIISFSKNWSDLRFTSFVTLTLALLSFSHKLANSSNEIIPVMFLILIFALYNIAAIIGSLKSKKEISAIDSVILGLLPIIILPMLNLVLKWSLESFGILLMLFAFVYICEMIYFKYINSKHIYSLYTLFSAGLITLNIGLLFILNSINWDYFMVLFVIEWFLFSYISMQNKEDNDLYKVYSYLFFVLSIIWYLFVIRFDAGVNSIGQGIAHATFFMFLFAIFVGSFMFFANKNFQFKVYASSFIIGCFLLIFSFYKYLWFFIKSEALSQIILSLMWLVYTLIMFSKMETKEGKYLVGFLLAITLMKIAFVDLFYLDGAFRILGFIAFGILLLIGGYFIKNDSKN